MKLKKIPILMVGVFLCVCCSQGYAQLLVEEGKIKKTVRPGQTLADTLTLHNSTDAAIDVVAYLEDFEYVAPYDGSKKFFPAGSMEISAADWISFQPKEISLPPYSKKKINYAITVPEDASGGYYSVLFFELSDRQMLTQAQVGIQVVSRVGSLFFLETEDRVKKIALDGLEYSGDVISAQLKNRGNINLVAKCLYYIMDIDGVPVDRGESDTYYMAPEAGVDFSIQLDDGIAPGAYTAVLTFDLEDGISAVHELDFRVN